MTDASTVATVASGGSALFSLVIPIIGTILSNVMYSSSLLVVRLSRRQRFLGKSVNPVPWAMGMVTVFAWQVYGVMVSDYYIISANVLGLFATTFSTTTALSLLGASRDPEEWKYIGYMEAIIIIAIAVWLGISYAIVYTATNSGIAEASELGVQLVSNYAITCTVLMYAAPLSTLFSVAQLQDASAIYAPQAVATLLNSSCWIIYGLFGVNNPTVYGPSLLGVISSGVLLIFKLVYPSEVDTDPQQKLHLSPPPEETAGTPSKESATTTAATTVTASLYGAVRKGSMDRSRGRGRVESNASSAGSAGSSVSSSAGQTAYIGQIVSSAEATGGLRQRAFTGASNYSRRSRSCGAESRHRAFSTNQHNSNSRQGPTPESQLEQQLQSQLQEQQQQQQVQRPTSRGRAATIRFAIAPEAAPDLAERVSRRFDSTVEAVRLRAETLLQAVESSILTSMAPVLRDEVVEAAVNLQELQEMQELELQCSNGRGGGSYQSENIPLL